MDRENIKNILLQLSREELVSDIPDIISEILEEDQVAIFGEYLNKLTDVCNEIFKKFPGSFIKSEDPDKPGKIYINDIANDTGHISFWLDEKTYY